MANAIRERNIRLHFLDNMKVFEKMDRYKKLKLLDGLEVQYFNKDNTVVKENEKGEYFYILETGSVKCTKVDPDSGEEKLVRNLSVGDYFGEIALINDDSKRTLTVSACEDTKLLAMNRDTFY